MPSRLLLSLLASSLVLVAACSTPTGQGQIETLPLVSTTAEATDPLLQIAERFYAAATPEEMRKAVEEARQTAPDSSLHHEIAAELAWHEDRLDDRFEHTLAALRDPHADISTLLVNELADARMSADQKRRFMSLLWTLSAEHPRHDVRALAAYHLQWLLRLTGRTRQMARLEPHFGHRLDMAVIGPWDNDQGKGFDIEYEPEREIDPEASYPAAIVDVSWRNDYPRDPVAGRIHVDDIIAPHKWHVAYAAAAVKAAEAGDFELRLSTNSPLKVWVNDLLVFANPRHEEMEGFVFDSFAIPLRLRKGANRVLIKVAQREHGGILLARLTRLGGSPPDQNELQTLPFHTAPDAGDPPTPTPGDDRKALQAFAASLGPTPSPRILYHTTLQARWLGMRTDRVKLAQRFVSDFPGSILLKRSLAYALWDNEERGKTSDLLTILDTDHGDQLLLLSLAQTRFWRQQKLTRKARQKVLAITEAHPDRPSAWLQLARLFDIEDWIEDECEVRRQLEANWPRNTDYIRDLASCLRRQGYAPRAEALQRRVLSLEPNHWSAITSLYNIAIRHDDFLEAERLAVRLTRHWPYSTRGWLLLGDARRRKGDRDGARKAFQRLIEMKPTDAVGYERLAQMDYEDGRRDKALDLWLEALARDPENDNLANRIAFLAPGHEGPWIADIPSEEDIEAAIATAGDIKPPPGANIVDLLDHEVTNVNPDGSKNEVVTFVRYAVNEAGRDALTKTRVGSGRSRILHAYAIDKEGKRSEASSIRGSTVRFRNLGVGSITVIQYRHDRRPRGFLRGQLATRWYFQGSNVYKRAARWILWLPDSLQLAEHRLGKIEVEETSKGDKRRVLYKADAIPPYIHEAHAPATTEARWQVVVSSVADWEVFWKWEEALLRDAFRSSPELEQLASSLFEGANDNYEKLLRIQTWVIDHIRYQQDYEGYIEGVRPHAAPVVHARKYGDCKDKAVLFITLAEMAGIDAHFALVRTRRIGPAIKDVPHQQFNHVIVYVPDQEGIPGGRFFDPTVDALDPNVLRADNQGTWSLVLDMKHKGYKWRQIPWQGPEVNHTHSRISLELQPDGSATGKLHLQSTGFAAAAVRKQARNTARFEQRLQRGLNFNFPGANIDNVQTKEVASIRKPIDLTLDFKAPRAGRREGKELRLEIPARWSDQGRFDLETRKLPLEMGPAYTESTTVEITLPAGARIKRLPAQGKVGGECLSLERSATHKDGKVTVQQTFKSLCGRIDPDQYPTQRQSVSDIKKLLDDEIVLTIPR